MCLCFFFKLIYFYRFRTVNEQFFFVNFVSYSFILSFPNTPACVTHVNTVLRILRLERNIRLNTLSKMSPENCKRGQNSTGHDNVSICTLVRCADEHASNVVLTCISGRDTFIRLGHS